MFLTGATGEKEEQRGRKRKRTSDKKRGKEREGKTEIPNPVPHLVVRDTVDVRRGYARDARASIAGLRADVACRWENKGDQKKGKGRRGVSFFFSRSLFLFPLCSLSLSLSPTFSYRETTYRTCRSSVGCFQRGYGGGEERKARAKEEKSEREKKREPEKKGRSASFFSSSFFLSTHVGVVVEVRADPRAAPDVGVGRRGRARGAAAVLGFWSGFPSVVRERECFFFSRSRRAEKKRARLPTSRSWRRRSRGCCTWGSGSSSQRTRAPRRSTAGRPARPGSRCWGPSRRRWAGRPRSSSGPWRRTSSGRGRRGRPGRSRTRSRRRRGTWVGTRRDREKGGER